MKRRIECGGREITEIKTHRNSLRLLAYRIDRSPWLINAMQFDRSIDPSIGQAIRKRKHEHKRKHTKRNDAAVAKGGRAASERASSAAITYDTQHTRSHHTRTVEVNGQHIHMERRRGNYILESQHTTPRRTFTCGVTDARHCVQIAVLLVVVS